MNCNFNKNIVLYSDVAALQARLAESEKGGERCQSCKRLYPDVYSVPDNIWEIITPKPEQEGAGLLCPVCAIERLCKELQAERKKVKYYHDKNQEKCAEIDTLRQELADLRGRLEEAEEILNHVNLQFPLKDYGLDVLEDVDEFLKDKKCSSTCS